MSISPLSDHPNHELYNEGIIAKRHFHLFL
jgi:hypothetical protein